MTKDARNQTPGRDANGAQPLGERSGLASEKATRRAGKASTRAAGPDGPDAKAIGDTFKRGPK